MELVTATNLVGGDAARLPRDLNATGEQWQDDAINGGAGFGGVEEHGQLNE